MPGKSTLKVKDFQTPSPPFQGKKSKIRTLIRNNKLFPPLVFLFWQFQNKKAMYYCSGKKRFLFCGNPGVKPNKIGNYRAGSKQKSK
jgi:hypothetical protein